MTMEIVGNDAQFNEKVTLLKDLEIYGDIKNKTNDTSFDFSDNLSFKIQGNEKLRITSDDVNISAQSLNVESVSTFNDDVVFAGAAYNMRWDHSTNDLILFDNTRLEFGSNKDFEIWHGGSHTFMKNSGGDLRIRGDKILLKRADGTERYLEANVNNAVQIFHNGNERFTTTSTGVVITGICTATNTAKAYVNFIGSTNTGGNCTIREDYNVSSVTDNGLGDYTITFTKAMANENYTVTGNAGLASDSAAWLTLYTHTQAGPPYTQNPTTTSFRITTSYLGVANNLRDPNFVQVVVFGN